MKNDLPERTFEFARRIIELCGLLDMKPGVLRTLGHQLLRSGTSIGANVQEGQASQNEADFLSKYNYCMQGGTGNAILTEIINGNGVSSQGSSNGYFQ